jgi:CHASE1-domain containing sensor protein
MWASVAQIFVSVATLGVALAVYRIQSEKLFHDTFHARTQAINAVIEAAKQWRKQIEAFNPFLGTAEQFPKENLTLFWQAMDEAKPLFGREIHKRMSVLEETLRDYMVAYTAEQESFYEGEEEKQKAFHKRREEGKRADNAISALRQASAPYTALGAKGLPIISRMWLRLRR